MIYLDNNASTALAPEVESVFFEAQKKFGNPSSVHQAGGEARRLVNESREQMAEMLKAPESSLIFTSGGTESINAALLGTFLPNPQDKHLVVSSVEHSAVLETTKYLESLGVKISYLPVDEQGRLDLQSLKDSLTPKTSMIAIMFANNEIGNIYPVRAIGEIAREHGIPFLCDGVQALGKLPIDLSKLPIDFFSASAHKFHGPKGAGLFYIHPKIKNWMPLIHGGRQERGQRAGTENVPALVSMVAALKLAQKNMLQDERKILQLRSLLQSGLSENIPNIIFHGDPECHLANTLNFRISGVSGESLMMNLDMAGIATSVGAACESGSIEASHVLLAMGVPEQEAMGGLRLSLSRYNTAEEIKETVEKIIKIAS